VQGSPVPATVQTRVAGDTPTPQPERGEPKLRDPSLRDLTLRDWLAIFQRAGKETLDDNVPLAASALAYSSFFAIPSTLLLALGVFSLVAAPGTISDLMDRLGTVMPAEATELLGDSLTRLEQRSSTGILVTVFGFALALSGDGNTLAVGAILEDSSARGISGNQMDNSAESSGAVYVFARTGTTWAQQAYIKASNTDAGDQFGWSVALNHDGTTLAVGAQSEASGGAGINANQADNAAADAGAAYVYVRRGTAWSQQAYIKASNAQGGDRFGFCLSLSGDGNTLAVCGYDEDGDATGVNGPQNEGAGGSGAAYVFVRRGTAWSQEAYVKASNTAPNAAMGSSIALSTDGSTLAVGSADEDSLSPGVDGNQSYVPVNEGSAGAVYVYGRTNGVWVQQAYVKPFNPGPFDLFGIRMSLSHDGSVLAAGSPFESGAGRGVNPNQHDRSLSQSGAVYVFLRKDGKWSQHAYLKAPNSDEYDEFGTGVALTADGTMLAAASSGEDGGSKGAGGDQSDNSVRDSGALYIF